MNLAQKQRQLFRENPKNWLHKALLWQKLSDARKYVKGRLLDVGCAEKPYQELYAPLVSDYVGVDHPVSKHPQTKVDAFSDAMTLPFKDGSFDTILATQVIEHLPRPANFFAEASRILRPGGYLIITAPHIWMVHEEPYDFYRYTEYGLKHLCQKTGLQPITVEPMGGFWVTFSIRLSYYLNDYLRSGRLVSLVINQLCRLVQLVGAELDKLHPVYSETHNYLLIAGK